MANHNQSAPKGSFSDYYHARYNQASMCDKLKKRITFANHNLVTDGVFGEMNVIVCRNVLIYFDKDLQNRVLNLFKESLCHRGFLCLGTKESLRFTQVAQAFEKVSPKYRIFRKCGIAGPKKSVEGQPMNKAFLPSPNTAMPIRERPCSIGEIEQ